MPGPAGQHGSSTTEVVMFDTINGLPLHPLVVHAAVVLIPLSGVLGVLYAVPRTRAWARWALPVVSVLALGSAFVATQSGQALQGALGFDGANSESTAAVLVERHSELGSQLLLIMVAYTWTYRVGDLGSRAVWNPADSIDYSD
ncbi:MAG: DUF2231 domain-containing protein [Nocardioidaceae bacterium]